MEGDAGSAPCEHFEASVLTRSCHQHCCYPEETHRAGYQEPGSPLNTEVPYCDLPRRPPVSADPPGSSSAACQSNLGLGLGSGPQRSPSAGLPTERPAAVHKSQDPETAPYLEGLTPTPWDRVQEASSCSPSSSLNCDAPDAASTSASVDWVKRQVETHSCDELTVMIPRKAQEGPRADSARRTPAVPVTCRSPAGGDTTGQRKEDTGARSRSAGQHWAKLRGGSGSFLEQHRPAQHRPALASIPTTPQTGPWSATSQLSSLPRFAQRDGTQVASAQLDIPPASSSSLLSQRDNPRTVSAQQDTPKTSFTQRNTPRASSPSRITQRDNPRSSSTQQNNSQVSSPSRATQQDNSRASSIQQDSPQTSCTHQWDKIRTYCSQRDNSRDSSPNRTTQRENSRTACAQRDNPRTSSPNRTSQRESSRTACTQRDNPRASSPNRTTPRENSRTACAQRDDPRTSSPNRTTPRENSRTACTQRDNPRASSPNRTTPRENSRTVCTQQDNPRASSPNRTTPRENSRTACAQRDNPRTSSPNRTIQRENSRTSYTPQDNPRTFSPNRTTQRENSRTICVQRDSPRASSPNRTSPRENSRTVCTQQDNPRASSNRATPRENSRTVCTQQDNPRASSPNRATPRENSRTSYTPQDNPRTFSPNRTTQRENSRTICVQRDSPRASSPNRTTQREHSRTACAQRDNPRASSPSRTTQRENSRTICVQRDSPRASSPNRTTQRENSRAFCAQQDNPRTCSPNRNTQTDKPRTSCAQQNTRTSSTQRDNPKASSAQRNNTASSSFRQDNPGTSSPQCCTQQDNPGPSSPHRSAQKNNPRNASPHGTNKDIPWASFPLRPTQSDGPRTASPSHSKQSDVPWASIALRPTQGDRPQRYSSTRPARSSGSPSLYNSPSRVTSSSHNPDHQGASQTCSPLYPATRPAFQTPSEPSQPPCAVCIGHRDAPRASSPPRYFQHDPFPFFPDPHASESESPHHEPPYIPPAVCIGHRDAPRASSPPRHAQFDPFPFLPDTTDVENQSPQHEPPQLPPPVCIGYRDMPRASSPPRQAPEPSLLFQDLPRTSTESLVPSTDSLHEPPHMPTPVCIGHRDAPYFSSPPRQPPEPSLFFQDPPGTSMESLAQSTDSLHGSPLVPPPVCIGHRDAPRASSPPRHPPSDLTLLASSPPPGSSGGSRGSAAPGETRHNLERREYTVLADLPPPRRLAQRAPGPQCSSGGRTRSPGRAEVERLFGQERRKSEAPGAFQAQDEGRSQQPGQGQSPLLRRQSSPALSREVSKHHEKQREPARRSRADPPHPRSPERRLEGDRRLWGSSPPPKTSARTPEREQRTESDRAGLRQPLGGWQSQEELPGPQGPHRPLERSWGSQAEGPGLGGWRGLEEPSQGTARAPEGTLRGPSRESEESWGQLGGLACLSGQENWETTPKPSQRGWGSLQELPCPHQPLSPPGSSRADLPAFLKSQQPEMSTVLGQGPEGACAHLHSPEKDPVVLWRDLATLLGVPGDASQLPRLYWEGFLELLQAQLSRKGPAGHWGSLAATSAQELDSMEDTKGTLEREQDSQHGGKAEDTLVNGHGPGQWSQSSVQLPSPVCTSTQWPKPETTRSEPGISAVTSLEELGQGTRSPAEGPGSPEQKFQSEEPEEPEPSRDQDPLTDQKQADSADKRPAEGKAESPFKGRLVTSWRMPRDRPTLFNPYLLSLGVLRWQRVGWLL